MDEPILDVLNVLYVIAQIKNYIANVATCGIVTVTEDHSLLDEKINKIKPGNVKIGETQLLLQDYPNMNKTPPKLLDIVDVLDKYETYIRTQKKNVRFCMECSTVMVVVGSIIVLVVINIVGQLIIQI